MKDFFKNLFTTDLWLKGVSVLIAFLLWLFVQGETQTQRSFDVELQIDNLPEGMVVAREFDPQISIRLIGPRTRLSKLDESKLGSYNLDFQEARKGINTFWIQEEKLKIPYGVEVVRVVPQVLRIEVDTEMSKSLEIKPRFVDQLEEGFEVDRYEINPKRLEVVGPQKSLMPIRSLYTLPISLLGKREYFESEIPVELGNSLFKLSQKTVQVKVFIDEKQISKVFDSQPVIVLGPGNFSVEPSEVSINVSGMASSVLDFSKRNVQITIDSRKITGLSSRKILRLKPSLKNLPSDLKVELKPETVRITKASE